MSFLLSAFLIATIAYLCLALMDQCKKTALCVKLNHNRMTVITRLTEELRYTPDTNEPMTAYSLHRHFERAEHTLWRLRQIIRDCNATPEQSRATYRRLKRALDEVNIMHKWMDHKGRSLDTVD